jgi:hypothetical protein
MLLGIEARQLQVSSPQAALGGRLRPGVIVPVQGPHQRGQARYYLALLPGCAAQEAEYICHVHAARAASLTLGTRSAQPKVLSAIDQTELRTAHEAAHRERFLAYQSPRAQGGTYAALVAQRHLPIRQGDQPLPLSLIDQHFILQDSVLDVCVFHPPSPSTFTLEAPLPSFSLA